MTSYKCWLNKRCNVYFTIENKLIKVKMDQMQTYMTEYLTPAFCKIQPKWKNNKFKKNKKNSDYEMKNKSASFFSLVNKNILNL